MTPKKRRPNAQDRLVADLIRRLPNGSATILIDGDHTIPLKIEGSTIFWDGVRRYTIIPEKQK
jgi:hypothetical protein